MEKGGRGEVIWGGHEVTGVCACVRACMCGVCVRACVRACVHACVRACVCKHVILLLNHVYCMLRQYVALFPRDTRLFVACSVGRRESLGTRLGSTYTYLSPWTKPPASQSKCYEHHPCEVEENTSPSETTQTINKQQKTIVVSFMACPQVCIKVEI